MRKGPIGAVSAAVLLASSSFAGNGVPPRINLNLYRADIHNVLRLLADVSHTNFVVGEDVKGAVTLSLRNVPWQEALEVVLLSNGLGVDRLKSVYRIVPLKQLRDEAEAKLRRGALQEQLKPLVTRIIPVNYARAADLVPHVKALLSARGTVSYDARTNVLIVTDVD